MIFVPVTAGALSARYRKGVNTTADDGAVLAFHAMQTPVVGDVAPCLSTGNQEGFGAIGVLTAGVRRLTPLEALRLQGFPDDWLDGLGLADGPKYRLCGNAVAVPVVEWLLQRILTYVKEN